MKKILLLLLLLATVILLLIFLTPLAQRLNQSGKSGKAIELTHEKIVAMVTNRMSATQVEPASGAQFIILSNTNCVLDNLTGLTWARDANIAGWLAYRETTGLVTSAEALNIITNRAGLNGNAYGGYTDWRLPDIRELLGLARTIAASGPAGTNHPFAEIQPGYYWSSTPYANTADGVWGAAMANGAIGSLNKSSRQSAWPVRGGQ